MNTRMIIGIILVGALLVGVTMPLASSQAPAVTYESQLGQIGASADATIAALQTQVASLQPPEPTTEPTIQPTVEPTATETLEPTATSTAEPVATETTVPPTATPLPATATLVPDATATTEPPPGGALRLTATFNTIGVELPSSNQGQATIRYRVQGGAWLGAFPLWHAVDAYYGSILFLAPGTAYEVQAVVAGVVYAGTIATRAEDIPAASALVPTHQVPDDYATLDDALRGAPAGAVVMVAAGTYAVPSVVRREPITMIASGRVVVEPPSVTGGWESVTLTGPATGKAFTIWKRTLPVQALRLAYETGAGLQRVAKWDYKADSRGGYTMTTPAGFAEVLYENGDYNYGFQSFGTDVYARFPGDLDPNTVRVITAPDRYIEWRAPNSRWSGFEFRLMGLEVWATANDGVLDANTFLDTEVYFRATQPGTYPSRWVIERNIFRASGIWKVNPQIAGEVIPWNFIKGGLPLPGGVSGWGRMGDDAETSAIWGRGGPNQMVARYNTINGYFNGIGGYNADFDRNSWRDTDIHDNTISEIADDAFEPERGIINYRVWGNTLRDVCVVISTGPAQYGPLYLINNDARQLGNQGVGRDNDGQVGAKGKGFKFSGTSTPQALVVVVGNTFIVAEGVILDGGAQSASSGRNTEMFYVRNNLFQMSRYAFDHPGVWDEDYNQWYTSDPARGLKTRTTMAAYRAATDDGDNSNPLGDLHDPYDVTDPRLLTAGIVVPNLWESTRMGASR